MINLEHSDPCTVLIVCGETDDRSRAAEGLARAGWRVRIACDAARAVAALTREPIPALVLIDLDACAGIEAAATIRGGGGPAAAVPILLCTDAPPPAGDASGVDDVLPRRWTASELEAAAARWRPEGINAVLDRLEAGFGPDAIGAIAVPFGAMLVEALEAIDRGTARPIAHRIAGTAGILGFAALGAAWRNVSENNDSHLHEARYLSRRAIATIAGRWKIQARATSV